jgi:HEAT repeat protein
LGRYARLVPAALDDLASLGLELHRGAVESLGSHSAPAVPAVIRGLDDRGASVRLASAHALGLTGTAAREALPTLAVSEADPDERVRRSAKATTCVIWGYAAGS